MSEITVSAIFDVDGDPAYLDNGIALPIDNETLDRTMMSMRVFKYPYIAQAYIFRLDELNGFITGAQPLDKLNSFAATLGSLSEYERMKLEGAVILTNCNDIDYCINLMHSLDSFDLTPNVGDYESLGRHFAANDFVDSLNNVPPDMMEHFDYELLGRMGWDDSTNVFIKGHHIRDTEHEIHECDLTREPNPAYLKLRFVSDHNSNGVWLKFPLSGLAAVDAPEQSGEMAVALKSLGVDSIEECRVKGCESRYPVLTKCMEYSEGGTLSDLIWKAHNLGFAESELGQYGKDAYVKLAAALEYEDSGDLDFAADVTQNLRCYDFAPTVESYAEKCLTAKGVDAALIGCFDLKTIGETLIAENSAVITETGVISRNEQDFIFDYYQSPQQENHTQEREIRLFCPLEVTTDPDSILGEEYGDIVSEFENAKIPNSVAADYMDEINAALEKEKYPEVQERGLAIYLDSAIADKVSYIWPTVEVHNDELWGVFNIKAESLTEQEMAELTNYCIGQASDGLGEGFEQRPVRTQDGDLYVSLWQSGGDYFLKPEEEFKQMFSEQEQTMQMNM